MNYSELKKLETDIESCRTELKNLNNLVAKQSKYLKSLLDTKHQNELLLFWEFIEIGTIIEFTNFTGLDGSPYLYKGEIVKIVKKNKKSIVIERVNKHIKDNVFEKSNERFRVQIPSLFHFYTNNYSKKDEFKKQFDTYLIRKESIDKLGI